MCIPIVPTGSSLYARMNSKAMLRIAFKNLQPLVPSIFHDEIRASQYYAVNSDSLVIQADSSRRQGDNVIACFSKLQHLFETAGANCIKGETSPEQIERVRRLYEFPATCMNVD